jgi:benzylsuccinate CoA-transferase BbsE subunit
MPGPLDTVRVIDLSGPIGHYAGRQLADLGADVIKVEPLEGDEARTFEPRIPNVPDIESSFQFVLLNANKRGLALDYETPAGRDTLLELVKTADVLLESFPPAVAKSLCLTDRDLRAASPDLIHTSVTGWGLSGPYADWAYADIVGCAMSGVMALAGFPDGPPEQLPDFQGYTCASIDAAAGTVAALLHHQATGEGQLVEVAMQEALSMAQETAMMTADILQVDRERTAGLGVFGVSIPGIGLYEAADGHVFYVGVGTAGAGFPGLLQFMRDEGAIQDLDQDPYATFIEESFDRMKIIEILSDPEQSASAGPILAHIDRVVGTFSAARPKQYLYEEGQRRRILVGMVSTPGDIASSPQLAARDWFIDRDDPGRGVRLRYPGFAWRLKGTPAELRRPAPLLGEHSDEVLSEVGLTPERIRALYAEGIVR